jgi:AcrR family transcriptional regulator
VILDATRGLVLAHGPRAASVAAIAKASGAPAGTLYHRFGNRDGVVTAAWLRALERFQSRALAAAAGTALDTATAMAVAAISYARELPDDAARSGPRVGRRALRQ